ncbi:hypothetical protein QUA56_15510 [Microcoleus sp. N3A4]
MSKIDHFDRSVNFLRFITFILDERCVFGDERVRSLTSANFSINGEADRATI